MTEPTPKPGDGKFSVATGVGWTTLGQFGVQGINFASSLALTLFLDPADFGLVGFGYAVLAVVDMLVDFGIGSAIVQRKELGPRTVDVAFTINALLAVAATSLIALLGGGLWLLGGDWRADAVMLWWLAPSCLFTAAVTMPRALLTRALRLDAIAKVLLGSAVVRAVASLGAAALGSGPYALVIGGYAGAVALVLMLRRHEHSRMRWCWNAPERPELLAFGVRLTMFNLVNTVLMNADAFVLKPLLGSEAFGLFALARRLLFQPVEMAGNVARSVLFPMLARVQHRRARARWLYLRADQLLVAGMLPLLTGAALLLDLLTGTLLSARWAPVAAIALAMLPVAALNLLLQNPGPLMIANGRAGSMLRWGTVRGLALLAAYLLSPWLLVEGTPLAMAGFLLLALPLLLGDAAEILGLPVRALAASLGALLPAAAAAAGAMFVVRQQTAGLGNALVQLLLAGAAGAIAWLLVAVLTKAPFVAFLRRQWQRRRSRRGR